jgi:hypothetical protein
MFIILIVILDIMLFSLNFINVTIVNAPFTSPFDISIFLAIRTKLQLEFFNVVKM